MRREGARRAPIVAALLAAVALACSNGDLLRAGIYEGLSVSQCRIREGENYPHMERCPQTSFGEYEAARKEHLEKIRAEQDALEAEESTED